MTVEKERKWQQILTERSQTVFLVRGLLRCACPEDIFDHYQVRHHVSGELPAVELILGERLLVWIMAGDRVVDPAQIFGQLLKAGLEKRDRLGLNRFRLVVVGDFPSWEKEWSHLAEGLDTKVHFHVLPKITTNFM